MPGVVPEHVKDEQYVFPGATMKETRILCPVDFSPCSNTAFRHAVHWAVAQEATLILVHVSPLPPTYVSGFSGYGPVLPYHPEPDSRLEDMQDIRVKIEYAHLVGSEGESIVKFAHQRQCSAIVMGTHGYRGMERFLFGSIAEFVLRHAKCPVIVVKDNARELAELKSASGQVLN